MLFDPRTVAARASYQDPCRPAAGIRHVYVNGTAVLREGSPTGALPGRALRRTEEGTRSR